MCTVSWQKKTLAYSLPSLIIMAKFQPRKKKAVRCKEEQECIKKRLCCRAQSHYKYRKVASSRLPWLVAHLSIFRLLMKGKFDAYVL